MKITRAFLVVFLLIVGRIAIANEGMWLPQLLGSLNEKEMKSLGMKISASDIYNINKGSLKDAIVSFGGFCTGEVISSQGLVLTNHHCGFDVIQNHSTLDRNYIRDGFWAMNKGEEIPNPGLFVTFIVRIDDVTSQVLKGVTKEMNEKERQSMVDKNLAELRKNVKKESYQDILVRGFFENLKYYLFVTETYRDVRLVGAPPSSIGNFGKDTDNWMWPRHTGDFSLFRIYAGKDNKPATYSADNIPYTPKRSLNISLAGVKPGDFTMVFGFPGRTNEYLHSSAVEQIMQVNDPAKIRIREKALTILDNFMRKDEQVKIMYASKYAGIQNSYKKWQGEVLGLTRTNAVAKKKKYEEEFQKRVNANPVWKKEYGNLLTSLADAYKEMEPLGLGRDYFIEIINRLELLTIAGQLNSLILAYENEGEAGYKKRLEIVKEVLADFYKEYSPTVDRKMTEGMLRMYVEDQPAHLVSSAVTSWLNEEDNDYSKLVEEIYDEAEFEERDHSMDLFEKSPKDVVEKLKKNKTIALYNNMVGTYQDQIQKKLIEVQSNINKLQRSYMEAQLAVFKEKRFYPDANSTMRVTYGTMKGYEPRDGVKFEPYTYLDGVMEKYIPGDYEFDVPKKLIELHRAKDYGIYASNGKMPVCFIAANHTTGGNSGSPALDAYGNLVGLNFDRVWEGTMSDINYDPSICRNIMVDARYILFIIDKFAGAGHLVKEMKLVGADNKPRTY